MGLFDFLKNISRNRDSEKSQNGKGQLNKKILKAVLEMLKLVGIALGLLIVIAEIGWYVASADLREIERKNKADPVYQKVMAEIAEKEKAEKERQQKVDAINAKKQEEAKAIADFEKSVKGKYTKESLLKIISSDQKMANRLVTMGGYKCMNYWYAGHNWDDDLCYDELSYYVFKDNKSAKKVFKTIQKNWIDRETDSGTDYVQGWESGVLDAEVEVFIYRTDNMIITTELQVVSSWAEPEAGEGDNSAVSFYYRKDFIRDKF